jgi:DNA-binding CsgD family transcriptional regulator/tetratricopeptide (TPR) repeat protein
MRGRATSTTFVGRREELRRLQRGLQSAAAGEPGALLIAGEAGVGKTRLVEEFADQVSPIAAVLFGRCLQLSGGGLPYGAIVDALRGLTRSPGPADLEKLIGPASDDLRRLLAGVTPTPSIQPVSEFAQSRLFESILRFLDRLAQEQPVVLIIEDIHWVDRSTLDLLMFLIRMVRHERLVVVATYRSDELHPQHPLQPALAELDRSRHVERLELVPFDREDLSLLLGGILGRPPSPATVQRILARSDGNAFLAEELLAAEAQHRQPDEELPRRLQGILLARVAALAKDTRQVLQLTATAGRPIEHHLLAAASELPEARLLAATREAVNHQVLRIERDAYRFRHVLLQQAVYGDLLPGERVRLHAAVAHALTKDPHAGALRQTSAELAHHWDIVGDYPRALIASIAAARAAAEIYGFTEAHHQYERALSLWEQVPDAHEQAGLALSELRREAAEAARWAGLPDRAAVLLEEALADLGGHIEPARAGLLRARLGECRSEAGDSKGALAAYEDSSRMVANEPASAEKARVLAGHATELMRQGQFSVSRALCEDAIAGARAVGALAEEGRALNTLGGVLSELGDPEAGIAALRQALSLSDAAGNFDDIERVYHNLGLALYEAGRPHEALRVIRRGLERMRELGLELARPSSLLRSELATQLWDLGRWQEAQELVGEVLTRKLPAVWALEPQLLAGRLHLARGRFDLAHEQGQTAARMVEQLNDPRSPAFLQRYLADLATWQGDYPAAQSAVANALQHLADTEDHTLAVRLCCTGLRAAADAAQRAHDQRANPSEVADIRAAGQQLLAHARRLLAQLGGNLSDARAHAAACEAEFTRLELRSDPQQWAALAANWEALCRPYEAAYARWRQAEALLSTKAPKPAARVLRQAHQAASELGARPLRHEIERLARRARIDLQTPSPKSRAAAAQSPTARLGLTPREQEVLRHLVEGRTNRQIARALFISEKTAGVHVSNIMGKLAAANRSEAAAIAHRLHLLEPNA